MGIQSHRRLMDFWLSASSLRLPITVLADRQFTVSIQLYSPIVSMLLLLRMEISFEPVDLIQIVWIAIHWNILGT